MPLLSNEQLNLDRTKKVEFVKKMHETVCEQILKKNEHYARIANRGRKQVTFEPGDWVWVHLRKERFPEKRRTKLHPRGDGPFQVLARIGDNAYKLDLPGDYGVSATFNVSDLFLFDDADSRTNPFQQGGNDGNQGGTSSISTNGPNSDVCANIQTAHGSGSDPLSNIGGPMTRSRIRKMKIALNSLVLDIIEEELKKPALMELPMVHLLHIGPASTSTQVQIDFGD